MKTEHIILNCEEKSLQLESVSALQKTYFGYTIIELQKMITYQQLYDPRCVSDWDQQLPFVRSRVVPGLSGWKAAELGFECRPLTTVVIAIGCTSFQTSTFHFKITHTLDKMIHENLKTLRKKYKKCSCGKLLKSYPGKKCHLMRLQ